jgi:hypothetical protein
MLPAIARFDAKLFAVEIQLLSGAAENLASLGAGEFTACPSHACRPGFAVFASQAAYVGIAERHCDPDHDPDPDHDRDPDHDHDHDHDPDPDPDRDRDHDHDHDRDRDRDHDHDRAHDHDPDRERCLRPRTVQLLSAPESLDPLDADIGGTRSKRLGILVLGSGPLTCLVDDRCAVQLHECLVHAHQFACIEVIAAEQKHLLTKQRLKAKLAAHVFHDALHVSFSFDAATAASRPNLRHDGSCVKLTLRR